METTDHPFLKAFRFAVPFGLIGSAISFALLLTWQAARFAPTAATAQVSAGPFRLVEIRRIPLQGTTYRLEFDWQEGMPGYAGSWLAAGACVGALRLRRTG